MTTHIDFKTAKLLKEKGFNLDIYLTIDTENPKNLESNYNPKEYQPWYINLTIAEVVMRLYEKHGIWITAYPRRYIDLDLKWTYCILKIEKDFVIDGLEFPEISDPNLIPVWSKNTEAYSEAIKYCLINLIK